MISKEFLKVPGNRLGVIIGTNGEIKKRIEEMTKTNLKIDSKENTILIESSPDSDDPLGVWNAKYIISAISRGFSPKNAFALLNDNVMLEIINLHDFVGRSPSSLTRVKGRIIGEKGKTRRVIEELTKTHLSVFGHTVAIIGESMNLQIAKEAVVLIVDGAPHSSVYRFLHRKRRKIKREEVSLWEPSLDINET
ncbi:MAG: KH domain-containing protein [Promethearchaeota archaeon]